MSIGVLGSAASTASTATSAAANAVIASRAARDVLARFVPDHPSALPLGDTVRVVEALGAAGPWLTLAVVVGLLLWRPRALRVLRTDRP